jgi:hypothetical protein
MIQWEEVELMDATHVEINGVVHEIKEVAFAKGFVERSINFGWIDILIEENKWANIPQEAFPLLGIKCLRKVKPTPIEFEGIVKESKLSFLFLGNVPEGIPLGKKFRCVEILEEKE